MTTEEFLREAARIMQPMRPIDVTYEDCLEVMRERYVLEDRLDGEDYIRRECDDLQETVEQLEADLRDAQNNVAELEVELEDLKAKDCPVCADRELAT